MNFSKRYGSILIRVGKIMAFVLAIFATTKLTLMFGTLANASTTAFTFLIIVLLSAFFGDFLVAISTSIVATLCFDYYFLPPYGTFYIASFSDWISLATFLLASVIISHLTASAVENKSNADALTKSLVQLKEFGKWLLSIPPDKHTLSGIAQKALEIFCLEYCSIHVYGKGKWQHFSGSAAVNINEEIERRLTLFQDHSRELMELADENILGVRYMQISRGSSTLALLAVKGDSLPEEVLGSIAYMIGVQLSLIIKSPE
jgi:K+-sensing histidine kinase KdpD